MLGLEDETEGCLPPGSTVSRSAPSICEQRNRFQSPCDPPLTVPVLRSYLPNGPLSVGNSMPCASYGPLQATGPRPSPKPRRKGPSPDRVGSQERVPKGCATGPRVPSTTATATLQGRGKVYRAPADRRDVRAPSGGLLQPPRRSGTRTRPRAAQQRSSGVPRGSPAQRPSPQGPRTHRESFRRCRACSPRVDDGLATWLILPVVICLSQRLSHACLSTGLSKAKPRMAH